MYIHIYAFVYNYHIIHSLFGCMTAIHYCPHCNRPFDYDASDYHRKIKCGHNTCNRTFGFYYFDVSERREREVRKEAKQQQEQAARRRDIEEEKKSESEVEAIDIKDFRIK